MIIRHLSRRQAFLRPVLNHAKSTPFGLSKCQVRWNHAPFDLSDLVSWRSHGIKIENENENERELALYSPGGFGLAWIQYQDLLLSRVNREITGDNKDSPRPLNEILYSSSRKSEKAALFNYVSMAINNEFYFRGLTSSPQPPSEDLLKMIDNSFSSFESFSAQFEATANAMFGGGFVWLVQDQRTADMRILATYNSGSPYPLAHARQQAIDYSNASTAPPTGPRQYKNAAERDQMTKVQNSSGFFGPSSREGRSNQGKDEIGYLGYNSVPILCINTWQYAWLRDWGWRKPEFIRMWWNFVDWERVYKLSRNATQPGQDSLPTARLNHKGSRQANQLARQTQARFDTYS